MLAVLVESQSRSRAVAYSHVARVSFASQVLVLRGQRLSAAQFMRSRAASGRLRRM
jgi:hypothetical protein